MDQIVEPQAEGQAVCARVHHKAPQTAISLVVSIDGHKTHMIHWWIVQAETSRFEAVFDRNLKQRRGEWVRFMCVSHTHIQ